jgi:hypothetical protein
MGNLIPNAALIYERVDNIVYARYRDPPHNTIPRWVVGGEPKKILGYDDWKQMLLLSDSNPTFKKQLDKVIDLYYILKDT